LALTVTCSSAVSSRSARSLENPMLGRSIMLVGYSANPAVQTFPSTLGRNHIIPHVGHPFGRWNIFLKARATWTGKPVRRGQSFAAGGFLQHPALPFPEDLTDRPARSEGKGKIVEMCAPVRFGQDLPQRVVSEGMWLFSQIAVTKCTFVRNRPGCCPQDRFGQFWTVFPPERAD
jgi:hypothetical protein